MKRRFLVGLAIVGLAGCQSKTEAAPATGSKPAPAPSKAAPAPGKAAPPPTAPGVEQPAAAKDQPADPGPADAAGDPGNNDKLGMRFVDPSWFRKEILPEATAAKVSRSEADDQGRFSSQILFDLPEGATKEKCADELTAKVGAEVPDLERKTEANRVTITGATDRYRVTLMCGEAKGVMKAYVSFTWTS